MNKKLLLATMSLAALAACTNDDFESKSIIAEETSPVQFEVINDAFTRASMSGEKIVWSAEDGDLFSLYHGATLGAVTGFENATYTANASDGAPATLTTPTMVKEGGAVMVWPVDTIFRIKAADALTIAIPDEQENIENNIPYVSDLINILSYAEYSETSPAAKPTAYTTAGKGRKYPVYMRPMASQLIVKADYAGSDATLAQLYDGGSAQPADGGIEEISVTNIDLLTKDGGSTLFTTEIPVKFTAPTTAITTQWNTAAPYNQWNKVTDFDIASIATAGQKNKLSAKEACLTGTDGCKLLILPQATISGGVEDAGVLVNTLYGRVIVADNGKTYAPQYPTSTTVPTSAYTSAEYADAWYRYLAASSTPATGETKAVTAETTGDNAGKFKTTANIADGMMQTINGFSAYKATAGVAKGEPVGAAATRYVKVLLTHLDMSDLHIQNDKHLRDAALVWKHLNLPDVTVLLDGDANKEFTISQKTIKVINDINASVTGKSFKVMPCQLTGEICNTIVITGASDIQNVQDMAFISANGSVKADVALKAGETWKLGAVVKEVVKVVVPAAGVNSIINRGTLVSDAKATLKTQEAPRATGTQNNVPFVNNGTWNVTTGTLNVQFDVTNNGIVNISKGAQYRQDGQVQNTVFTNEATAKPSRFGGDDTKIGVVNNEGVFATVSKSGFTADINNYGLIEHADVDAKTYITKNETATVDFGTAFGTTNKMGRINLPYSNKDEDNVSISAATNTGFVSITIDGDAGTNNLNTTTVGSRVNYVIVKSGIETISNLPTTIKYVEIADKDNNEIAWAVPTASYTGLMILSDVNIKIISTISATTTYLGKDMYVGGKFNNTTTDWDGYYGNTTGNVATKYITY